MNCAIIIPTTRFGDMINACVVSALDSGKFDGDIYVVSNEPTVSDINKLGSNVKFVHTNTKEMLAPDACIYAGFKAFDQEYDLIIYAHSDTLFNYNSDLLHCDNWWGKLQDSWSHVDKARVWGIGIPIPAGHPLDGFPDNKGLICPVNDEHHFGFGSDLYNPLHGTKFSPVHSIEYNFYAEAVAKYGSETGLAMEHFLFYEGVQKHKWSLIANNGNYINHQYHIEGIDTRFVKSFNKYCGESYSIFHKHHGMGLDHFVAAWFGLTLNIHKEEILNAIYAGDYDSIDYIFAEGSDYINNPDCNRCLALNPDMKHCRAINRPTVTHTTY